MSPKPLTIFEHVCPRWGAANPHTGETWYYCLLCKTNCMTDIVSNKRNMVDHLKVIHEIHDPERPPYD